MGEKEAKIGTLQNTQMHLIQEEASLDANKNISSEEEILGKVSLRDKHLEAVGWVEESIVQVEKAIEVLDEAKSRATSFAGKGQPEEMPEKMEGLQEDALEKGGVKVSRDLEGEEDEDEWGCMDEEDIMEARTLEQSEPEWNKIHLGEKRSRGRKPNQVRIVMAGSAKGQCKLTVGKGITLLEGQ